VPSKLCSHLGNLIGVTDDAVNLGAGVTVRVSRQRAQRRERALGGRWEDTNYRKVVAANGLAKSLLVLNMEKYDASVFKGSVFIHNENLQRLLTHLSLTGDNVGIESVDVWQASRRVHELSKASGHRGDDGHLLFNLLEHVAHGLPDPLHRACLLLHGRVSGVRTGGCRRPDHLGRRGAASIENALHLLLRRILLIGMSMSCSKVVARFILVLLS